MLKGFSLAVLLLSSVVSLAQEGEMIDKVIAVVGGNKVTYSDIQRQKAQYAQQGMPLPPDADCQILEEMLFQALLLNQAELDSVVVDDGQVEQEMDRRLEYFILQMGGDSKKLEEFYGKSIPEIKEEFKSQIKDQMLIQQMQGTITSTIDLTPKEVKEFFNAIPKDSLPLIGAQVEVSHLTKYARITKALKDKVFDQCNEWIKEIQKGETSFATVALFNSADPGSSAKGGDLGWVGRGTFVPEFEAVAFSQPIGVISEPFETQYGVHFLEVLERRGNMVNCRHVLVNFEVSANELVQAKEECDKIASELKSDTLSFDRAILKYSDDEDTKNAKGILYNPASGETKWDVKDLDPYLFNAIDQLKPGDVSEPRLFENNGKKGYRLVKLNSRTEPHRANLSQDYSLIQRMARSKKEGEVVDDWVRSKINTTYIRLDKEFQKCNLRFDWTSVLK